MANFIVNTGFEINCGFLVSSDSIRSGIVQTNQILSDLPSTLYKSIDYKTTSAMIGSVFCDSLTSFIDAIVNPIEKGHPDLIPPKAATCSEEQLRNYPEGLEIKCTVGNIKTSANLRAGQTRIEMLTGITWQAHHREVSELLGLVWDFVEDGHSFNFPTITGAFYSNELCTDDWGEISGTTGRNTKVTGMGISGKKKMGNGWVVLIDNQEYVSAYSRFLRFSIT
ncbi:hypothetical protein [Candidatus Nitrotoga arctica]|uniref:R.SnaBI endonuclease n=1 Tax=Candidatus Nitrotoga arctica TaxID=453162 RepID=A0ABN8AL39_9PROT|nr:hypothetical protein [Candidatus Nitrotoga arctica]CAG9932406.1 R.SnaBI endonuclease [Candidatus Nitrotoga arctica]